MYILFHNDLSNMPTTTFYNNIQNSGLPLIQTLSKTREVVYQGTLGAEWRELTMAWEVLVNSGRVDI